MQAGNKAELSEGAARVFRRPAASRISGQSGRASGQTIAQATG